MEKKENQEINEIRPKRSWVMIWLFVISVFVYVLQIFDKSRIDDAVFGIIMIGFAIAIVVQEMRIMWGNQNGERLFSK